MKIMNEERCWVCERFHTPIICEEHKRIYYEEKNKYRIVSNTYFSPAFCNKKEISLFWFDGHKNYERGMIFDKRFIITDIRKNNLTLYIPIDGEYFNAIVKNNEFEELMGYIKPENNVFVKSETPTNWVLRDKNYYHKYRMIAYYGYDKKRML